MAFQFPASPIIGQVFNPIPGVSFKWNGTGWAPFSLTLVSKLELDNALLAYQTLIEKAAANGYASLDSTGKVPTAQLPVTFFDTPFLGMVSAFAVSSAAAIPSWVELTGQALTKTVFPRLWAWVSANGPFAASDVDWNNSKYGMFVDLGATFRIPQILGQFVRSANVYTGIDAVRAPGSIESHTFQDHAHNYEAMPVVGTAYNLGSNTPWLTPTLQTTTGAVSGSPGAETRPWNVGYRHFIYAGNPL